MGKWINMTDEQRARRKVYMRQYLGRYRPEHREKFRERMRKWRVDHREERQEYHAQDLNSSGEMKSNVRKQSRKYLLDKHSKLDGYEIHHCFGYEDFKKFIYIPKTLHIQIHQLLRDNNIPSDSDHWMSIRDLVNSCEQYTYILV